MRIDAIPIWAVFAGTTVVVMVAIEAGYLLGQAMHRRSEDEKESPVSAIAGAILGLAAFMLAFTFGIVSERYDTRRALVREDAVALRTAWQRADFLPDTDRAEAKTLLRQYVDLRVQYAEEGTLAPGAREAFPIRDAADPRPAVDHGGRERTPGHEFGRGGAVHRFTERGQRHSCVESGARDSSTSARRDLAGALLHHDPRHGGRGLSDGHRGIEAVHGAADPGPVVRPGFRADRFTRSP